MYSPNFTILYVSDIAISRAFYTRLLGKNPDISHPAFVMFFLGRNMSLAIWRKEEQPLQAAAAINSEITFHLTDNSEVDAAFSQLNSMEAETLQAPHEIYFGYTFTCVDPDGHCLRFFSHSVGWEWLSPPYGDIEQKRGHYPC